MHALHFREVIGRSWPAIPEGTSEVKKVELQESFRLRSRDLRLNANSKRKTELTGGQPGWLDTNSQGTPARWRPFGPAYPQDERGRGTRDGGILPEQILSAARNLNSGWNTDQNVPHLEMQRPFWVVWCLAKLRLARDTFSSAPFMSASREFSRDMLGLNLYLKMRKARQTCLNHRKGLTSRSRYGAS